MTSWVFLSEFAVHAAWLGTGTDDVRSTIPDGAYFVLVNTEALQIPADFAVPDMIKNRARDWYASWFVAQTCVSLPTRTGASAHSLLLCSAGVVTIPPTDFYSEPHWDLGQDFIRMFVLTLLSAPKRETDGVCSAFCKDLKTLRDASERLLKLKPFIKSP